MLITVASGHIDTLAAVYTDLELRLYVRKTFVASTGQVVARGEEDSEYFYKAIPCTVSGQRITYAQFTIDSTSDGNPTTSSYSLVLYDTDGNKIDRIYKGLRLPPSPTSTDLGAIVTYSGEGVEIEDDEAYTKDEVDAMLAALVSTALPSNTARLGVLQSTYAHVDSNTPYAVSSTDPRVNKLNAGLQASFSAAVDAAAALPGTKILQVTQDITASASKTIPTDVILELDNGAKITPASGVAITIQGEIRAGAWQIFDESAGGTVNVTNAKADVWYHEWYGITVGADNTLKLQRLIDQRKNAGAAIGTYATNIVLAPGVLYTHASPLDWDLAQGIKTTGAGSSGSYGSGYHYTGDGGATNDDTVYSFYKASELEFTNVLFHYSDPDYAGYLVCSGGDAGRGMATCKFSGCNFYGLINVAYKAKALVNMNFSYSNTFLDCRFWGAQIGYTGRNILADVATVGFSNRNQLINSTFNDCGIHIFNPGQSCTVSNSTNEANFRSLGGDYRLGDLRILDSDGSGGANLGFTFNGTWAGDIQTSASTFAVFRLYQFLGAEISQGFIEVSNNVSSGGRTTVFEMHSCSGISVGEGMRVNGGDYAVAYDTSTTFGCKISGDFQCTNVEPVFRETVPGFPGAVIRQVILGAAEATNSISGGVSIYDQFKASSKYGATDIGWKTTFARGNRSAFVGQIGAGLGYAAQSLLLLAPYQSGGGEASLLLGTQTYTTVFSCVPADINTTTDTITSAAHGFVTGDTITFVVAGGTAPEWDGVPIVSYTDFFVYKDGVNSLKLCETLDDAYNGTAINLTTAGVTGPFQIRSGVEVPRVVVGSSGFGYTTGNGGTSTQATLKSNPATALNKPSGTITMAAANLVAGTIVSFTMANTCCDVGDTMEINHISGGTLGAYTFNAAVGADTVTIYVRNATAGDLAEALVLKFNLTKGVNA